MKRVAVVFTGGTISMRRDPETGGARPVLAGADILQRTPGLDGIADIEAIDWGLIPASHLTTTQMLDIAGTVQRALGGDDVAGAVVVQGTDTLEEVAFAHDLVIRGDKPVVFVGAMRNADEADYDGPRNLRDGVRVAASEKLSGQGVAVVMAGLILPAHDAVKTNTESLAAFLAPNAGPLGSVDDTSVDVSARRAQRAQVDPIPNSGAEPVMLITVTSGMDGTLVRKAIEAGAQGLVIAATGAGNTHPDVLEASRGAMSAGLPVVLATRCVSGPVKPAYAFPGGGLQWQNAGAIMAGTLGAPKARVALSLALGAGLDRETLRRLFDALS